MFKARWTALSLFLIGCGRQPGHAVRDRLVENIGTLSVSISLLPFGTPWPAQMDPGVGLRAVLLYQGEWLISHPILGPEGPVSADAELTPAAMIAVVEALERLGVWKDASPYYSPAGSGPVSMPPPGERYRGRTPGPPSCEIRADFMTGEWRSSVISTIPWGAKTVTVLRGLRPYVPALHADRLLETCDRFR